MRCFLNVIIQLHCFFLFLFLFQLIWTSAAFPSLSELELVGNDWRAREGIPQQACYNTYHTPHIFPLGRGINTEQSYIKLHKVQCCLGGRLNSPVAIQSLFPRNPSILSHCLHCVPLEAKQQDFQYFKLNSKHGYALRTMPVSISCPKRLTLSLQL